MRGAEILASTLEAAGVEYAFGLAGSAILGVLDAIDRSDIKFVTTRHEQVATSMAAGYALASRRPTVSIAHVGPGAANQVLGLAAAHRDNIPVIAISGNEPSHRLGLGVRHEWDVTGIFERFTKHNVRVTADRPAHQIQDAVLRAVTGVPGPIHIDFPRDLEEADLPAPSQRDLERLRDRDLRASTTRARPSSDAVDRTVRHLSDAEQPLLIVGSEIRWSEGSDAVRRFVEATGVPGTTSKAARGALPESNPLSLGPVGRPGMDPTNEYLRHADLVIAAGARLSDLTTSNWELIGDEAAIVHATLRTRELDRHYLADVNAVADPASFLEDVTTASNSVDLPAFTEPAAAARAAYEAARERFYDPTIDPTEEGVDPRKLVVEVERQADEFAYTTGGGVHAHFPRRRLIDDLNGTFVTANFAGMSQGFPLAMGAQLALDRPVFAFEGDGGFAMVMQDLETAVREAIPVKVFVLNNESYMSQRARQRRYYEGRYAGSTFTNPDFAAVAREFGAFGETVTNDTQIPDAVAGLLGTDGPGVLDIHIDPWLDTGNYDRD